MSSKPPAFQFYPSDWLGSQRVSLMTLEEEGAYIRLLSYCWQHGSIPADPEQIARLIGKGATTSLAMKVATMFQPPLQDPLEGTLPDGYKQAAVLVHDRLLHERLKQIHHREKSREGGLKSAAKREKAKKDAKREARGVEKPLEPKSNSSSSSSSSIAGDVYGAEVPSLETVKQYAQLIGLAEWKAEDWFHEMESVGWVDYRNRPVNKWQPMLTRVKTKWEADGRPMKPTFGKVAKSQETEAERKSDFEF
jgi:hypothetical protein